MLLVTRAFLMMHLGVLLKCSRVTGFRFPQSMRSVHHSGRRMGSSLAISRDITQNRFSTKLFCTTTGESVEKITSAIALKGDEIRVLKANKAAKDAITPVVAELLQLKKEFELLTGNPFDPPKVTAAPAAPAQTKAKAAGTNKKEDSQNNQAKGTESTVITPRATDYSAW